jgi:hypothetical protein
MIRYVALTSFIAGCMHRTADDDNQLVEPMYQHVRVLGMHMYTIAVMIRRFEVRAEETRRQGITATAMVVSKLVHS